MSNDHPAHDGRGVDPDGIDADEVSTGAPIGRPWRIVIALALIGVAVLLGLVATNRDGEQGDRTATPSGIARSDVTVTPPRTTVPAAVNDPPEAVRAVSSMLCRRAPRCLVMRAANSVRQQAQRALGPDATVDARTVGPHLGLVIAAATPGGAQLLAIVTPQHAPPPDVATLGITPPLGVQTQSNGADRLTVAVSGSVKAITVLSGNAVQRWLATLRVT